MKRQIVLTQAIPDRLVRESRQNATRRTESFDILRFLGGID
jgi:hypothetical protein